MYSDDKKLVFDMAFWNRIYRSDECGITFAVQMRGSSAHFYLSTDANQPIRETDFYNVISYAQNYNGEISLRYNFNGHDFKINPETQIIEWILPNDQTCDVQWTQEALTTDPMTHDILFTPQGQTISAQARAFALQIGINEYLGSVSCEVYFGAKLSDHTLRFKLGLDNLSSIETINLTNFNTIQHYSNNLQGNFIKWDSEPNNNDTNYFRIVNGDQIEWNFVTETNWGAYLNDQCILTSSGITM